MAAYQHTFNYVNNSNSQQYEATTSHQPMLISESAAVPDSGSREETAVCGTCYPELQPPTPLANRTTANFKYECPRCHKRFSRRYTIKQHFPGCITKRGNPDSLKWNDNDSSGTAYKPRKENRWNAMRKQMKVGAIANTNGYRQMNVGTIANTNGYYPMHVFDSKSTPIDKSHTIVQGIQTTGEDLHWSFDASLRESMTVGKTKQANQIGPYDWPYLVESSAQNVLFP